MEFLQRQHPYLLMHLPPITHILLQSKHTLRLLLRQEKIAGYRLCGRSWDCGNKLGYLEANIEYAIRHPNIGSEFKRYLLDKIAGKDDAGTISEN